MDIVKSQIVSVGIAEMDVVYAPNFIRTSGLGSCVGVVIYDLGKQIAGLAHVMLPDSTFARKATIHPAKYADTAVEALILKLKKSGARETELKAKMAGGAQMFKLTTQNDMMKIGERNVNAVKFELNRFSIPLLAEDVGGNRGRTVTFNPTTGLMSIRTVNQGSCEI